MTKEIPLTKGKVALVDEEDFEELSKHRWSFDGRYAIRMEDGKKIYLHREALKVGEGKVTDHVNRDRLDNRKSNLREASYQQNSSNSKLHSHNTSGYRGVYKYKKLWRAAVTFDGKQVSCGYFKTKQEAAIAYNEKATELFGEFAYINEINEFEDIEEAVV